MLIAGPNLTIDRTLRIEELRPGEVLRFEDVAVTPGGKGVNVARVAQALGAPAVLVGFTPGHTGDACARMLADEGLALRAVPATGELRSTAVVLEHGGRVTVFNEPGPALTGDAWTRYVAAIARALGGHHVLACSGSAPPGAPRGAYAELAALARSREAFGIVDANGPLLAAALEAGVDLVTPNLGEAEALLHGRADEAVEHEDPVGARDRAARAAVALRERGARAALVTAGAAGAALADGAGVIWHPAPSVTVVNPIGAGDSVVGGLAVALERGEGLRAAVRAGLAAAAASVETAKAGAIDPARVAALAALAPAPEAA
jgi:1-phosphofructokinase family hexose kinase